jgi:outer membrane lipoprotein carrier protein
MKRALGTVMVVLAVAVAYAETAEDVLERVRRKYDSIKDAQIAFSQKVKFSTARLEQNAEGTLYLKKGNRYRLELSDQIIVTNGQTVWSYSVPNNQVLIDNFKMDERSLSPEKVLTGAPTEYYSTLLGKENIAKQECVILKLVPRNDDAFVRTLRLWVDGGSLIRKAELLDINGKSTEYIVHDVKVNTGVQDSRFIYEIPEDADVVDLR